MEVISVCGGRTEGSVFPYKRPMACGLRYVVQDLQLASNASGAETRGAAGAGARIVV
jgi:hypothetical protein